MSTLLHFSYLHGPPVKNLWFRWTQFALEWSPVFVDRFNVSLQMCFWVITFFTNVLLFHTVFHLTAHRATLFYSFGRGNPDRKSETFVWSCVCVRVARSRKIKRPNLAISSFKKGQILKNEKKPNKGQILIKKFVKITKLKLRIS